MTANRQSEREARFAAATASEWFKRVLEVTIGVPFAFYFFVLIVSSAFGVPGTGMLLIWIALFAIPGFFAATIVRSQILAKWPNITTVRARFIAGLVGFLCPYIFFGFVCLAAAVTSGGMDGIGLVGIITVVPIFALLSGSVGLLVGPYVLKGLSPPK